MPDIAGPYLLPPDDYPLRIRAYGVRSGRLLWETTLERPDGWALLEIPPLGEIHGEPVRVETITAGGHVERADP